MYDFIKKANEIHNYKYDYSRTNYKNNHTNIVIVCPIHGEFTQRPTSHLLYGCKLCSKETRRARYKSLFIKKANEVHNYKYDYSNVNYKNKKTNVLIECPIHGFFQQKPKDHLSGSGCQKCGLRLGIKEFISRSNVVHKNKFDYSKTKLELLTDEVIIICPIHGEFKQLATYHIRGSGCIYCAKQKPTKENNLLIMAPKLCEEWDVEKNGNSPEEFLPMSTKKAWWLCQNGHSWRAVIGSRFTGSGCPFCSGRNPTEDYNLEKLFPELCEEWSDKNKLTPKYYTPHSNKKVWWRCKNGHEWETMINARTNGQNCPSCSNRVSCASTLWLDKININIKYREKMIKIGNQKFFADALKNDVAYEFLGDYWHGNPSVFNPLSTNPTNKELYGMLLYKTIIKLNTLANYYKVIYRWESFGRDCKYKSISLSKNEIIEKAHQIYIKNEKKDVLEELCPKE